MEIPRFEARTWTEIAASSDSHIGQVSFLRSGTWSRVIFRGHDDDDERTTSGRVRFTKRNMMIDWGLPATILRNYVWAYIYVASFVASCMIAAFTFEQFTALAYISTTSFYPLILQLVWMTQSENADARAAKESAERSKSQHPIFYSYALYFRVWCELSFWGAMAMVRIHDNGEFVLPASSWVIASNRAVMIQSAWAGVSFSILASVLGLLDFAVYRFRRLIVDANDA